MRKNPNYLKLEGVFRKAGSFDEEEQIILAFEKILGDKEGQAVNFTLEGLDITGYSLAAVIKKFFTKLLTPIFPYDLYNKILETTSISSELEVVYLKDLISQLPPLNRKTLIYLTSFIKYEVITLMEENKMNNYNMSVVFCPCFFRSKQPSVQDLMNSGKFAGVLNILFNKYDDIISKEEAMSPQLKKRGSKRGPKGSRGSRGSKGQKGTSP